MKKNKKAEKKYIRITPKMVAFAVFLLWILSISGTWFITKKLQEGVLSKESFTLLNPRLKTQDFDTPEDREAKIFATLVPLKDRIINNLGQNQDNVGFYIEDLNSGSWIGWKERDPFIAASLLKTPMAIGAMKKVDKGEWSLDDTTFRMESKYKDDKFGDFYQTSDGTEVTLRKVMEEMLQKSDNTASAMLVDKLTLDERADVFYHIGVVNPEDTGEKPLFAKLSPKEMSSVFRALYNSTFLRRKSSEYILTLLTNTDFNETRPPEISKDTKIAHKIGNFLIPGYENNDHDCGIVYIPEHPYIFCTMTQGMEQKRAESIMSALNQETYNYFTSRGKDK